MNMKSLRQAAVEVAKIILAHGHECYFAGGCVRDNLLGVEPNDFDIVTSALPDEILRIFPATGHKVGEHFGVILVQFGGFSFDVATFRKDGDYLDGRHPDKIFYCSAQEDALRRDFTINGLFEHPLTGEIVDFVGGVGDLEGALIRAIGSPSKRFEEDSLRLMRAIRFATTKNFTIETDSYEAICNHSSWISKISMERIKSEFDLILLSPNRSKGIKLLVESGLMKEIIPEFLELIGCKQPPEYHPEGDVYIHTMLMLSLLDGFAPLTLVLAVLLHDIGKPSVYEVDATGRIRFSGHASIGAEMSRSILKRMKYSNKIKDEVSSMVKRHMDFMNVQKMKRSTLRKFISSPLIHQELELHRVDCSSSHGQLDNYDFVNKSLNDFKNEPVIPRPYINGDDLVHMGLQPGPRFKEILDWAFSQQLDGFLMSREEAINAVRKRYL